MERVGVDVADIVGFGEAVASGEAKEVVKAIVESTAITGWIEVDAAEMFLDLQHAINEFELDRAAGPKSPWRHFDKQLAEVKRAALKFERVLRNPDNALAVDLILREVDPEKWRDTDGRQAPILIDAMKLNVVSAMKVARRKPREPRKRTDRGTVSRLTRVDLPHVFRKHFQRPATSSLGTKVQPDSEFIRFALAVFDHFEIRQSNGKPYLAHTIATYMKPKQTGVYKRL